MTDVSVRQVTPDDWASYRTVRLAALVESPGAFSSTLEREQAFTEEVWRTRLAGAASFLAWRDGQPVGTLSVLDYDPSHGHEFTGASHLVAMWVDPQERGLGVADELVTAALAHVRAAGAPALVLWVFEANERACGFYRRMGFRSTDATMYQPHRPDERECLMICELGPS
jgi:ribosomal protein S18 acetylase RimI-like enzyme